MNRYTILAREGVAPVVACVLLAMLVLHYFGLIASLIFWLATLVLVVIFREPAREVPAVPLAVLSPADGKVTAISMTHDPYLDRPSIRVAIQMNPYGSYSTRSPIEGKVLEPPHVQAVGNKPHGVWLQTDEGDDVVMVMNRGRLHTAPRCYVRFGERVGHGQRCGFIYLGAEVELYLPDSSRTVVSPGDWVRSGSDVIANLVHSH